MCPCPAGRLKHAVPAAAAVTGPCNGLCSPMERVRELHADPKCHAQDRGWPAPPLPALDTLPVAVFRPRLKAVSCKRLRGGQVDMSLCDALDAQVLGSQSAV